MIFLFFGFPGAGKTTLVQRFGALHGIPGIDTDSFMTDEEIAAVHAGHYTQEMRLANIARYCQHARTDATCRPHVALADGLPNNAARRFALGQFPPAAAVLVHIRTDPALWAARLTARADNVVDIDVAGAEAYIRDNWEDVDPALSCEAVDNGPAAATVDTQLRTIFERHAAPGQA